MIICLVYERREGKLLTPMCESSASFLWTSVEGCGPTFGGKSPGLTAIFRIFLWFRFRCCMSFVVPVSMLYVFCGFGFDVVCLAEEILRIRGLIDVMCLCWSHRNRLIVLGFPLSLFFFVFRR